MSKDGSSSQPTPDGKHCFAIVRPKGRRKSFGMQKVQLPSGDRADIESEEVATVNRLFLSGTLTFEEALKQLEVYRASLYKARDLANPKKFFHAQNAKVLEDYWRAEYSDRDIIDPKGRFNDLKRAVGSAGSFSLAVATKEELQKTVDASCDNPNLQRTRVSRLNQILKFLGRGFVLRKKRKVHVPVKYHTVDEFETVLAQLKDPEFVTLCKAAFATGARAGELFALQPSDCKGSFVLVETQIDIKMDERETKTRKRRKAFIIKERREWLTEWLEMSDDKKKALRKRHHATLFRRGCKKAFKGRAEKNIKFHDLRHSYAVYLLSVKGAPLDLVAQSLGNSPAVCFEYYQGFMLSEHGIEYLERL